MRKARFRGFSLIEICIVLFLTGLILFAVAQLIMRTLDSLKFLQEKSRTLESASLGCERLSSELREAVGVDLPIPIGQVSFRKVRPPAPEAVGNSPTDPPEGWTRVYPAAQLASVLYQVDPQNRLTRSFGGNTTIVANDVNSFVVDNLGGGSFKVSLAISEKRRIVTFETITTSASLQGGP